MMKNSLITKGVTILCFISLVCAFVLYRSGHFNKFDNNRHDASGEEAIAKKPVDSIIQKKDSQRKVRLPSSKSIIVTDIDLSDTKTSKEVIDSIRRIEEQLKILSSSKSTTDVISPSLFLPDSSVKRIQKEKTPKSEP